MPPDPPRRLRLRCSRGALRRQENVHVRCFQKYVRYFTKQLKTLDVGYNFSEVTISTFNIFLLKHSLGVLLDNIVY